MVRFNSVDCSRRRKVAVGEGNSSMEDQPFGNENFHTQERNNQRSYSRNSRQSRGSPRRARPTQQHISDQYFYRNNSRARANDQFSSRYNFQYQLCGRANHVNYRGKRSEKQYERNRGNLSEQKIGHLNDNENLSKSDSVSETSSCDTNRNDGQVTASHETSVANDVSEGYASYNSSDCQPQDGEQSNTASNQRGYVVGGRYMRKNTYSQSNSSSFRNQRYYSRYEAPERTNSPVDHRERNAYSRFQRGVYPNSHVRDNQSRRGYNSHGRQKVWRGPKAERPETPDVNDNVAGRVYSPDASTQCPVIQGVSRSSQMSSQNRDRNSASEKSHVSNSGHKVYAMEDEATQRDRLILQLHKGEYECMVCCESIRSKDQIWHCSSCYHVFHLRCIRKWARSPAALVEDAGWRCPACQNITKKVPYSSYCFCGKQRDPEVSHHLTPHSCGEVCQKERPSELCPHRCNILCHPGPCPPCTATVTRPCGCGKVKKTVPCRQQTSIGCGSVCNKILNCGIHNCESICHSTDCEPCFVIQDQVCFCGKNEQQVLCTSETANCKHFTCNSVCGKKLECGNHYCEDLCHPGPCAPCVLLPSSLDRCPCGKTPLKWLYDKNEALVRKTCVDPIPVCNALCNKILLCGPKDNLHTCDSKCHLDECPPCTLATAVKCRCGSVSKEMPCVEYVSQSTFLCEKRCTRRKDCGRHKCLTLCCVGLDHVCELVCNKKLSCGTHQCEEKCHMGNCPPCKNVSFDELTCHCGASVIYPPVHCGTRPPECKELCTRRHPCDHPVQHRCHNDEVCPPCTVLTVKWCYGKHMQRKNVQCFLEAISCGLPCGKPLPCNVHKCQDICHEGPCLKNNTQCTQPCSKQRPDCDHPCGAPCHEGPCPDTPCKAKVQVSCPCGNRTELLTCSDSGKSYHLLSGSALACKIQDIKLGHSVSMSDFLGKKNRLQCNEECSVIERNKRLAVALQIQNPDLSCKPGPPTYSEFLKEETKKSPQFVIDIYQKLTDLVKLAKESKKKSRSHAFPPMNRDHRRVIHELAEFFGCESQSYDEEPKKSVTVTALKDKSWLPFVSIITVVQREMGQRKGPTPVIPRGSSTASSSANQPKDSTIDYFDFKEES